MDGGNSECATLRDKSKLEIAKADKVLENVAKLKKDIENAWISAWKICESNGIKLGYTATNYLEALPQLDSFSALPRLDQNEQPIWPVLFLYPQYNQIDIIQVTTLLEPQFSLTKIELSINSLAISFHSIFC